MICISYLRHVLGALLFALHLCGSAATPLPPLLSQYTHTAWGALEGAPTGVLAIAQTTDGWLWITTEMGLYRYDGIAFERVQSVYGHRLVSNQTLALRAGDDGSLWVGYHGGGVSVFRRDSVRSFGERNGLPRLAIADLKIAPDAAVWVATGEGVLRLAAGSTHFERQSGKLGLPSEPVLRILFSRDRTQWIASASGVYFRRQGEERFTLAFSKNTVIGITEAPDGRVWAQADADKYYPVRAVAAGAGQPSGPVLTALHLSFDRDGYMWLLNRNDVERKREAGSPGQASQRLTRGDGLSGSFALNFFQDREGNIWIGTSGGIDRFRRNRVLPVPVSDELFFPGLIHGPKAVLWVSNFPQGVHEVSQAGSLGIVSTERFTSSRVAGDGTIWIAGRHAIKRWGTDGSVTDIAHPDSVRTSPGSVEPQAIELDRSGALWASFSGGRGIFRLSNAKWVRDGGLAGFPQAPTFCMSKDQQGKVWMGHVGNMISLVASEHGTSTVRRLDKASGLDLGSVMSLTPDGPYMWAGGERGTMLYREGRFVALRGARGESFRGVSGIARLPDGDLWLYGVDGLYRIRAEDLADWMRDPAHLVTFRRFDALDGLRGHAPQIRPLPSLFKASDGKLWLASASAVAMLDPANIYRNTLAPPVLIRTVESNGTLHDAEQRKVLTLPQGTDSVRIAFTALSLSIPERVRFRYRLNGVDRNWQEPVERRGVSYTNLGPGRYRFEVRAANEDGVWSPNAAALDIHILPTFVQTAWFKLILIMAGLIVLYAAYLLRVRHISRRMQERHRAQMEERTRIARSLHDTLLQSIQGVLLSFNAHARRVPEGSGEREKLERTLNQAWSLVVEGRDQITGLRASASTDELCRALQPIGADIVEYSGSSFEIRSTGQARILKPDVHHEMVIIGREALFNAGRYAQAQHLLVELHYGEDTFVMRVRDDGRGLDADIAQSGVRAGHWGLPGMRERAECIGASFEMSSEPGKGTEVAVALTGKLAYEDVSVTPGRRLARWLQGLTKT